MKTFFLLLLLVLVDAIGVLYMQQQQKDDAPTPPVVSKEPLQLPEKEEAPPIRYPIPEPYIVFEEESKEEEPTPAEKPLPDLSKSDDAVKLALESLINLNQYKNIFHLRGIIYRFVVTVDNLSKPKLANKFRITRSPPGQFLIEKDVNDNLFIHKSPVYSHFGIST